MNVTRGLNLVLGLSLWFAQRLLRRPETLAPHPQHPAST
jgi:hypothetical protein